MGPGDDAADFGGSQEGGIFVYGLAHSHSARPDVLHYVQSIQAPEESRAQEC